MRRLLWITIFGLFITAGWALGSGAGDTATESSPAGKNGESAAPESETGNVPDRENIKVDLVVQVKGGDPAMPIRNAEVMVRGSDGTELQRSKRTDDEGQVLFQGLPKGKITVIVIARTWNTFKLTRAFNKRKELVKAILQQLD